MWLACPRAYGGLDPLEFPRCLASLKAEKTELLDRMVAFGTIAVGINLLQGRM